MLLHIIGSAKAEKSHVEAYVSSSGLCMWKCEVSSLSSACKYMISVQLQRATQPRQATLDLTIFCVDEQQLMTWSYV